MKQFSFSLLIISLLSLAIGCKKENDNPPPPPPNTLDLIKDTAVAYVKEIYLWNNQIPSSFTAKNFSDLDAIMMALRNYSVEPGFNRAVDEWSFAMDQETWDDVGSGISGDMGIQVFFNTANDLRVKAVEPKSPAGLKGVRRGWRIISINGNSQNIVATDAGVNFILNNLYYSNSATVSFRKPDGSEETISLAAAQYQNTPVVLDSIYADAGIKVGYLSFQSFLGDSIQIFNEFDRVFNRFSSENIDELIIDLRYNGGGYVNIQDKLANYIVPAAANNQVMMKQVFNSAFSDWNETTLFNKTGNLELSRIFFIVTEGTASASELLINNLSPFMEVKVVGRSPSYGKPVGYFPIPVGDWYIFPVSFRSTNNLGSGNYFDGFIPDIVADDNVAKDWGDIEESSLGAALSAIFSELNGGIELPGRAAVSEMREIDGRVISANNTLSKDEFKGLIDTKKRVN